MVRYCSRLILVAVAMRAAPNSEPPTSWIDPDTGHRIVRLTREPGSASLYFNQNGYTADGKKVDRKSTRLNSSHSQSRMPSSA